MGHNASGMGVKLRDIGYVVAKSREDAGQNSRIDVKARARNAEQRIIRSAASSQSQDWTTTQIISPSKVKNESSRGGSMAERVDLYLSAASSCSSPSYPEKKKVSPSISDKIKLFSTQVSRFSPTKSVEVSPGRVDQRVKEFITAASTSSTVSSYQYVPRKIDEELGSSEDATKESNDDELDSSLTATSSEIDHDHQHGEARQQEEGRERTNALVATTPSKAEAGHSGSTIRSFNEGANASLRRTASWLRQQRAAEEASKVTAAVEVSVSTPAEAPSVEAVPEIVDQTEEFLEEPKDPVEHGVSTPPKSEDRLPPTIMKRTGSFKKDKRGTPAEKRVVRFGMAEIHSLPSSPKSPETPTGMIKGSASGHSASKGSALAAYLKSVENGGGARKRPLEEVEQQHTNNHVDSPPPPMLSPGSRSPNGSDSPNIKSPLTADQMEKSSEIDAAEIKEMMEGHE